MSRIEPYGFFIVLGLVLLGVVSKLWLQPVMALTFGALNIVLAPLAWLVR